MYEEKKVKFNWKGFLIKLLILVLVFILIIKLVPMTSKNEKGTYSKTFNSNMTKLKEVGNTYFSNDNLPKALDESITVKLKDLVTSEKIETLNSKDGNKCDEEASYIKAIKKSVGYELEVHLICDEEEDTSYVYLGCLDDCGSTTNPTTAPTTTTTTTKKTTSNETTKKTTSYTENTTKKTTKKTTSKTTTTTTTTTRVKKYAVIFNVNGGSLVQMQNVKEGERATRPVDPTRQGFTFAGWYTDTGKVYNFTEKVDSNIILIAKWYVKGFNNTIQTELSSYNTNVYTISYTSTESTGLKIKNTLNVPSEIAEKSNISVKSITYNRNMSTKTDLDIYKNNITNQLDSYGSKLELNNIGTVDNVQITYTQDGKTVDVVWTANVATKCEATIDNKCAYGIVYKITWNYSK